MPLIPQDSRTENTIGTGAAAPKALDPLLIGVRESGLRVMRVAGTTLGTVSLAALGAQALGLEPSSGSSSTAILVLGTVFGFVPWIFPFRRQWVVGVLLVAVLSAFALGGLWSIGPSMPVGALLVVTPVLATFFFGRRAAFPGAVAVAVALVGAGVASKLAGRPMMGTVPGARLPYSVYVELATITLGNAAVALAAMYAMLGAVQQSLRRATEAAERERTEHERRLAAERSLAQAKRVEAVANLASGVAHDTRNALVVMGAGLKELRAGPHSREDEEVLADVARALGNVTHTMQQLLWLGRRQASAARPVALAAVVEPFVSSLRRIIPPEVELRLEGQADALVHLDPAGLEQALLNVVLNARDAMPAGGLLTLRLRRQAGSGVDQVVIEVEDTGSGMDPPTAARMFEPFFTTKPPGEGTGLGLTLVQQFVAEAGGTIEVDSAPGRGTRVRLVFPALPHAEPESLAAATS